METGFLNFHDEEHFSTLPSSSIYHQTAMLDDDSSLLDMIPDQLDGGSWADLDRDLDRQDKDDFHKMLTDWQDQLGSLQCDNEELYDADDLDLDNNYLLTPRKPPLVGKDLSLARLACEEDEETRGLLEASGASEMTDEDFQIDVDDDIDVETVVTNEQIPVLEAGDVTTLLEQFEASESINTSTKRATYLDSRLFAMATQPVGSMSHQNIIDALPWEVIERIKASGRKKAIPVIPAMPSRKPGRGTRMQDAGAALTRNKLLKIVSSSPSTGESIQLDHDYCSAANSPEPVPTRSFYHSDASDYRPEERAKPPAVYSRLPDYYLVLNDTKRSEKKDKDSGLESGELSDASEDDKCDRVRDKIVTINGKTINLGSIMQNVNKALTRKDKPMVSVLKRNASPEKVVKKVEVKKEKEEPKKRKLNLSEYRSRVRELDRHRSSCDSSRATSPITPSPEEAKQIFEQATQMLINTDGKIDEETFARMKKTLERQALLQISTPKPKEMRFQLHEIDLPVKKEPSVSVVDKYRPLIAEIEKDASTSKEVLVETNLSVLNSSNVLSEIQTPVLVTSNVEVDDIKVDVKDDVVDMEISDESFLEECSVEEEVNVSTREDQKKDDSEPSHDRQVEEAEEAGEVEENEGVVEEVVMDEEEVEKEKSIFEDRVKSFDRSRRQFRSRRRESSSSSSSNSSQAAVKSRQSSPAHSRSHSRSSSSSYSSRSQSCSSKSRRWSRSRYSRDRSPVQRGYSRAGSHARSQQSYRRSWRRSRSPARHEYQLSEREKERQVEERRVIYVGRIGETMTKAELRARFETFGPIVDISLHFREHADNYGFVTFAYKVDAYSAVEQGKKDPALDQFDLSFGGRRAFCKSRYADLDVGRQDDIYGYATARPRPATSGVNFDDLLREAMKKKK